MKRKISVMVLSLSLAVIIAIATVGIAVANDHEDKKKDNSNIFTTYGQHGEVILQLPQPSNAPAPAAAGTPSHPTCLRLVANDYEKKSTFGAYDTLLVALWIPAANQFVPVAQINNHKNPALDTYLQTLYANTPVYNSLMPNVIDVTDKDLDVSMHDGIIIANLTTTVKITLPFNLRVGTPYVSWGDLTFNLPPLTLMFRPTAPSFKWEETTVLAPSPPLSGYTINLKSDMSPAWVKVDIPTWVKSAWLECSGHICTHIVQTSIPPAA